MAYLNKFLVGGLEKLCYESRDGSNWEPVEVPGGKNQAVMDAVSSENRVVIVLGPNPDWAKGIHGFLYGNSLDRLEKVDFDKAVKALDRDGNPLPSSKQEKGNDMKRLDLIAYGGGRFVATGGEPAHGHKVYTSSSDGERWSEAMTWHSWDIGQARNMTFGNDRFLAVGDFKRISTTRDGEIWEFNRDKDRPAWLSVAYGAGRFVAGGLHGLHGTSDDGLTWENLEEGEIGHHLNSMLWTGNGFIGLGTQVAYFSRDGLSWRHETIEPRLRQVAYGNGWFLGSDVAGRKLYRSSDAIRWEEIAFPEEKPRIKTVRFV